MIHDDKFQTIPNVDKAVPELDRLTLADIFRNSREYYFEEEYNDDGRLMYKPPPLHSSWLDESESRDRKEKVRRFPIPSPPNTEEENEYDSDLRVDYDPPDLVDSDVESEDESEVDVLPSAL